METPLGPQIAKILKYYFAYMSSELEHLSIKRFYYPLYVILEEENAHSQKFLAQKLNVDKVYMVRILDYLELHDCIKRKKDSTDRRKHCIVLTKKGLNYAEKIKKVMSKADEVFINSIPENKGIEFKKGLDKMSQELEHLTDDDIEITIKHKQW